METSRFPCCSHLTHQEMANHNSMHLDQACIKTKMNKLKNTSEVTLQDSNLEVYWQGGKRPRLVHSRDTLTEHPPAGNWHHTRGRWEGKKQQVDYYISVLRLASSDISLFKSLYLLEQVDTLLFNNKNIR